MAPKAKEPEEPPPPPEEEDDGIPPVQPAPARASFLLTGAPQGSLFRTPWQSRDAHPLSCAGRRVRDGL